MSMLFSQVADAYKTSTQISKVESKKDQEKQKEENKNNKNEQNIELIENEETSNNENLIIMVSPEKIMSEMNVFALMNRNMCVLNTQLNVTCSRLNAKIARYNTPARALQQAA